VDEILMRREIAPSRIACTAFSQAKWYINTPEKSNKTLPGDERRENRSFFHMTNLWTTITRVDSYVRQRVRKEIIQAVPQPGVTHIRPADSLVVVS